MWIFWLPPLLFGAMEFLLCWLTRRRLVRWLPVGLVLLLTLLLLGLNHTALPPGFLLESQQMGAFLGSVILLSAALLGLTGILLGRLMFSFVQKVRDFLS